MKKTASVLLAASAAALLSASARAANPNPQPPSMNMRGGMGAPAAPLPLDRCDKPMAAVDFMLSEIQKCRDNVAKAIAEAASPATPVSTVTYTEIPAGTVPQEIQIDWRAKDNAVKLMRYYANAAFVTNDLNACAPLKYLYPMAVNDCKLRASWLAMEKSWYGSAREFTAACTSLQDPEAKLSAECCQRAYALKDQPDGCRQLVPGCFKEQSMCRMLFQAVDAQGAACKKSKPRDQGGTCGTVADCEQEFQDCVGDGAYARAARAGTPGACGGNRRCRTLMGQGQQVLREDANELMSSAAGKWFLTRGWERPYQMRVEGKMAPAPNRAAQAATQGRLPSTLPNFTCQPPLGSVGNRKVVADIVEAADACLTALDASLLPSDRRGFERVDHLREQVVKAKLTAGTLLEGSRAAPKQGAAPAKAPARRRAR